MKLPKPKFYNQVMSLKTPAPKGGAKERRQRRLVKSFEKKVENLLQTYPLYEGGDSEQESFFEINLEGLDEEDLNELTKKIDKISEKLFDNPKLQEGLSRMKDQIKLRGKY